MRETTRAIKALSDETRLRVLSLLLERECCVCEVMQALEISQSRASRSLSALYDAGFLKLRRDGLWALYSIDRDEIGAYRAGLIRAVQEALGGDETVRRDVGRLAEARRVGPALV